MNGTGEGDMPDTPESGPGHARRRAIARCRLYALERVLDLPESWRILRIIHDESVLDPEEIGLVVEGPDLPSVEPGRPVPRITLHYQTLAPPGRFQGWELSKYRGGARTA